jgi:drug/metabolite transporter (DMT)-like permease
MAGQPRLVGFLCFLTPRGLVALALASAGTSTLFLSPDLALESEKLPGIMLALAAAVLFAYGTVTGVAVIPLGPVA